VRLRPEWRHHGSPGRSAGGTTLGLLNRTVLCAVAVPASQVIVYSPPSIVIIGTRDQAPVSFVLDLAKGG